MLIAAFVCTVLMAVALLRKKASAACVSALGAGTTLLLWHNHHPLTGTATWNILLALTGVMLILNCFKRTRRVIGLFAYILLTGFVLWQGLDSVGALVLFSIAAIVALFRARKFTVLSTAALIVVASLGLGVAAAPSFMGTAVAAEQPGDPHNLTVGPDDLLPSSVKCSTTTFNNNSLKPVGKDGRLWVDSVSTPFTATSTDGQFAELTSEICTNPTLGDAYAQALADAKIGDFSVADANSWLGDFLKKSNGKDGLRVWLSKSSDGKTIYVTGTSEGSYQYYAQMVNTLLYMLDNQGTKTTPSTANWPLGLVVGTLPRVHKTGTPEDKPYMALTYTRKSGDTCPYVLGVNLKDKRPLNVSCATATTVAPPTPTKPHPEVTPPSGKPTPSTTPTKPGHTPTSTPTPSTTPTPSPCPPGYTGKPGHCLEVKDPTPIPTNSHHTPGASPSGSPSNPNHPSQPATPTQTSGGGSTQTAPGASTAPKPTKSVPPPEVSNEPTKPAEGCTNPITGEAC